MSSATPRLLPSQVCFVVDDVPRAAAECSARYGWGPFHHFTARVPDAQYRGWSGTRVNDVALGMAGGVQVELVHVHEGREPIADYQARYGTGFQHLGIGCRSRDAALAHLEKLGAVCNERNEHGGILIAFVDVPTGPAMFELLQFPPRGQGDAGIEASARPSEPREEVFALDRATLVTPDLGGALRFHAAAFGWDDPKPRSETLRFGARTTQLRRYRGRAGRLELELLEPTPGAGDPYAAHLERGDHGLIHAGGTHAGASLGEGLECEWLDSGEVFQLHDWAGGRNALQVRQPADSALPFSGNAARRVGGGRTP